MVDNKKPNDWFVTLLFNPSKDFEDLETVGFTEANTALQSRDYYKSKDLIQKQFTDKDSGVFDEARYNQFYDSTLRTYNNFVQNGLETDFLGKYQYDIRDTAAPKGAIKNLNTFEVRNVPNPMKLTKGVVSLFGISTPEFSYREMAQTQKIFDIDTNTWLDKTPNDPSMRNLNFIFNKPLVMAAYEEDGFHIDELTKRKVKHSKGEYKLNSEGLPYYETLGKRSAVGKDILHFTDTLTVDGSRLNKYDFFDSDGLEKSVTGSVAKLLTQLIPYAIPYVRNIYAGTQAALTFSQAIGAFGQALTDAVTPNNKPKPKIHELFRNLDVFGRRFEASVSDEDQQSAMNFSNATTMLSDIVGQLFQQRFVAQVPMWLGMDKRTMNAHKSFVAANSRMYKKQFGETLEDAIKKGSVDKKFMDLFEAKSLAKFSQMNKNNARLASSMSQYYMAFTQTADIYDTMKENGFSDTMTSIGVIGGLLGFKKIFDSDLGKLALDGLGLDDMTVFTKEFFKTVAKDPKIKLDAMNATTDVAKANLMQKIGNKFSKFIKAGMNSPSKYLAAGFSETLEELSEEALQDVILKSASILENNVFKSLNPEGNKYSWLESDPLTRYLMAGAGGFVGGNIFTGINALEAKLSGVVSNVNSGLTEDVQREAINRIRNGQLQEILGEIDRVVKKGETGLSKTLSLDLDTDVENDTSKHVFKLAESPEQSQNAVIGKIAENYFRALDALINSEDAGMIDEDIMLKALGKERRVQALQENSDVDLKIIKDFDTQLTRLVNAKAKLESEEKSSDHLQWRKQYNDAKANIDAIASGERLGEYTERMLFMLNRSISSPFMYSDIDVYALSKGINYSLAPHKTKKEIEDEYKFLVDQEFDWDEIAFKAFQQVRGMINSELLKFEGSDIAKYAKDFHDTFKESGDLTNEELDKMFSDFLDTIITKEEGEGSSEIYKKYFEGNNLNPNNLKYTKDQIKEKVQSHILLTNEAFRKILTVESNKRLISKFMSLDSTADEVVKFGFDQLIASKDLSQLLDFVTKARALGSKFNFIDNRTYNALNKVINSVNSFNATEFLKTVFAENLDILIDLVQNNFSNPRQVEKVISKYFEGVSPEIIQKLEEKPRVKHELIAFLEANPLAIKEEYRHLSPKDLVYSISDELVEAADYYGVTDISPVSQKARKYFIDTVTDENGVMSFVFNQSTRDPDIESYIDLEIGEQIDERLPLQSNKISVEDVINKVIASMNKASINTIEDIIDGKFEGDNQASKASFKLLQKLVSENLKEQYDLIKEAKQITSNVKNNPVMDALSTLSKSLIGEDVFEILKEEDSRYTEGNNFLDYVFSNRFRANQLNKMSSVIDLFKSAMFASTKKSNLGDQEQFDFNDVINRYNEGLGKEKYASIEDATSVLISEDLSSLEDQINFLIYLDNFNSGSKFTESSKTQVRMNTILSRLFTGKSGNINYDVKLRKITVLDDDDKEVPLFSDLLTEDEESNLNNFYERGSDSQEAKLETEGILSNIEHNIFERFNKQSPEIKRKVILQLMDITDFESPVITSINKDSDLQSQGLSDGTAIGLNPKFINTYILSILATDTFEFKSKFNQELLDEEGSIYAPFHNQIISMRIAYAFTENSWVFNEMTNELKANVEKYYPTQTVASKGYEYYDNVINILGQPGSGKTTAVGWFLSQMARRAGKNVIVAAPTTVQAAKLGKTLNNENYFTKSNLFKRLLTESGFKKYEDMMKLVNGEFRTNSNKLIEKSPFKEEGGQDYRKYKRDYLNGDDVADNIPDVIMIDEYTHFTTWEMQMLDTLGAKIINLGDTRQEGFSVVNNLDGFPSGPFVIYTPELGMSVRSNNIHSKDNLETVANLVRKLDDILNNHIANPNLEKTLRSLLSTINFKYYEDIEEGSIKLDGAKFTNSISEEYVRGLIANLEDGEKIALIRDNPSSDSTTIFTKLLKEFPDKVIVKDSNDVQGQEFKYTIIDVEFKRISAENNVVTKNNSTLAFMKEFYTLMSRSSDGTVIITHPKDIFDETFNKQMDYTSDISFEQDQLNEFKQNYINILNSILPEEFKVSEETEPTSNTIVVEEPSEPDIDEDIEPMVIVPPIVPPKRDSKEIKKFKEENSVIYGSYNHYSIKKVKDIYEGSGLDEDLGAFNFKESESKRYFKSLAYMKALFLRRMAGIPDIPNTVFNNNEVMYNLEPFVTKYFKNSDNLYNRIYKDSYSGFRVKVSTRNEFNSNINGINTKSYKENTKDPFLRLVYSIHLGDGKFLDITVGSMPLINNISNKAFKDAINNLDLSEGKYYYFKVDNANFRMGNIEILTEKDRYDLGKFEDLEYTLDKYAEDNPNLIITQRVLLPDKSHPNIKGQPVAIATWDLYTNHNENNLATTYLNDRDGKSTNPTTQLLRLNRKGYAIEEYFERYYNSNERLQDLRYLYASNMLSSKIAISLIAFAKDENNFNSDLFIGKTQEQLDSIRTNLLKFINDYVREELFNSSFKSSSKVYSSIEKLMKFIEENLDSDMIQSTDIDETKISDWKKIAVYLNKADKNIFKGLEKLKNSIAKGTSKIKGITAEQVETIKKALYSLDTILSKQDEYEITLPDGTTLKSFKALAIRLIEEGIVIRTSTTYEVLENVTKAFMGDLEISGISKEDFRTIVKTSLDQSGFFPNGMYVEGIENVLREDGTKGYTVEGGFFRDISENNQFYVDAPAQLPRTYIDYNSIELTPYDNSTIVETIEKDMEDDAKNLSSEIMEKIGEKLLSLPNLSETKFNEQLNKYLNGLKGTENIKTIVNKINNLIKDNWVNNFIMKDGRPVVNIDSSSIRYINENFEFLEKFLPIELFLGGINSGRELPFKIASIEGLSNEKFKATSTEGIEYEISYSNNDFDVNSLTPISPFNEDAIIDRINEIKDSKVHPVAIIQTSRENIAVILEEFLKSTRDFNIDESPEEFFRNFLDSKIKDIENSGDPIGKHTINLLNATYEDLVNKICKIK